MNLIIHFKIMKTSFNVVRALVLNVYHGQA